MKKYKYLLITTRGLEVLIEGTHLDDVTDIISKLPSLRPNLEIAEIRNINQEVYAMEIRNFLHEKGKAKFTDTELFWWIAKHLCQRGWKPLGEGRFVFGEPGDENVFE